ncbi:hypothetical protein P154DRAFT_306303 [Amniculicola lignicola CBS 123094]|uniref:Secreted protein n=1 Tax=Amniculicola lignicola CBS 123094 TaxID=1392246 RepID=A0A6A5W623_9PLEO|nr:hypothetical protein P154DRAFT_306303 [Amniculicola lignicola CBS 123094]
MLFLWVGLFCLHSLTSQNYTQRPMASLLRKALFMVMAKGSCCDAVIRQPGYGLAILGVPSLKVRSFCPTEYFAVNLQSDLRRQLGKKRRLGLFIHDQPWALIDRKRVRPVPECSFTPTLIGNACLFRSLFNCFIGSDSVTFLILPCDCTIECTREEADGNASCRNQCCVFESRPDGWPYSLGVLFDSFHIMDRERHW